MDSGLRVARGGCGAEAPCCRVPVKVKGEDLATPLII